MRKFVLLIFCWLSFSSAFADQISIPYILKSKIITLTRDLTAATGSVAYTGVGFMPNSCLALGSVGASLTSYTTIFGMVDSSLTSFNMTLVASTIQRSGGLLAFGDVTGANSQTAQVSSFDSDGFTLSWTKTGTPTGTANVNVICFR